MDQLAYLMAEYPLLKDVILFCVAARIVFKPIFVILGKYVELTVEMEDDKKLAKIMDSKAYKMAAFLADYCASIKLPSRK